jgi:hypothetical protein
LQLPRVGPPSSALQIEDEKPEPWSLKFIETADVAASLPRHGGVKPPLQKAERRSALPSADLKVGATIPLSYRVEGKIRLAMDRPHEAPQTNAGNARVCAAPLL